MIVAAKNIDTSTVTLEQITHCQKVEHADGNFYMVESESGNLVEYKVTWNRKQGFQCTCEAGQSGFAHCRKNGVCKHVVWSVAAAREDRPFEVVDRFENKGRVSFTLKKYDTYQIVTKHADGVYTCSCVQTGEFPELTSDCEHCQTAEREEELFHAEMIEHAHFCAGNR